MITHDQQDRAVQRMLQRLHKEQFWGNVVLQFRRGDIFMTRIDQTITTEKMVSSPDLIVITEEESGG